MILKYMHTYTYTYIGDYKLKASSTYIHTHTYTYIGTESSRHRP